MKTNRIESVDIAGVMINVEIHDDVWYEGRWTNRALAIYDGRKYWTHDGVNANRYYVSALDKLVVMLTPIVQRRLDVERLCDISSLALLVHNKQDK